MKKFFLASIVCLFAFNLFSQEWIPDPYKNYQFRYPSCNGTSILAVEDTLFIGGSFDGINTINCQNIIKYYNGSWHALNYGIYGGSPYSLLYKYGNLFVGGTFSSAMNDSGISVTGTSGLCRWESESNLWKPIGINSNCFVLVGGGASGKYFLNEEINKQSANLGTGAVIIYDSKKISLIDLMTGKLSFLLVENCGKCTPCREGIYRLKELVDSGKIEELEAVEVIYAMLESSFCGLGTGAGESFTSLWEKKDKIWKK